MSKPAKYVPDAVDWFKGTWEGHKLATLQDSWRMTFRQKMEWLEEAQKLTERMANNRKKTLIRAIRQWAD